MSTLPFGSLPATDLTQTFSILAIALIPTSQLENTATPFSQTSPWTQSPTNRLDNWSMLGLSHGRFVPCGRRPPDTSNNDLRDQHKCLRLQKRSKHTSRHFQPPLLKKTEKETNERVSELEGNAQKEENDGSRLRKVCAGKPAKPCAFPPAVPAIINCKVLKQFPSYLKFIGATKSDDDTVDTSNDADEGEAENTKTPLELIESSFESLHKATAEELLAKLKTCSPAFFERVVVLLLRAMG